MGLIALDFQFSYWKITTMKRYYSPKRDDMR